MAAMLNSALLTSLFVVAASAEAKTYRCEGKINFKPALYTVELSEVSGLASDSLWFMKVVNSSEMDGKTTSGVATTYSYSGPYSYNKDSRYFELKNEVLAVNPKSGSVTFTSAERMGMPIPCTVEAE